MTAGKTDNQEKGLHRAFIGDMADIASRFLPGDIFGGTPRPGKTILDDVLTLSEEAHEKESENSRIAPLLFTMGGGEPLWFVGDSPKRVLNDFKPERDNAICKGIVPDGKTPADGLFKRLGYAHRVYTLALNIDGRRTSDYVSATIDVDVDIPLFTPVDEYRKTGKQGKLDQLIRQAVLGKKGRRWLSSVSDAIDKLVESGEIEETPYWKLKKAFMYFSKNFSAIPVVEVDPVGLKAHFTLYTAYMPMMVHQELTRIISETFFKGMYDEALTADNRMLALSRVGSMSKSDGLDGKFLYRRFLWFGCQDQKTLATLLQFIRIGLSAPKLTDQQLSDIRSLAMENGVQVNRGRGHQYKAIQFTMPHHPDNMATDEIDAYSMYAWLATKNVPYSFSMINGIGDNMADVVRSGMYRAKGSRGKKPWICAPSKNFADCDEVTLLSLNFSIGEDNDWDPKSIGETRHRPLLHTWNQITVNHLVDYNEENEPTEDDEKDAKPRREDNDRPVRRRPRRIVGDEAPAPAAEAPAPVDSKDNEGEDDERPVRRRVVEEDRCYNCGKIHTPPDTDNEEELARWRRDFAARHGFEYEEFDRARARLVEECIESDPRSPEHYGPAGHPELAAVESALDAFEDLDAREDGTCVFTFRGGRTYTRRVAWDENGHLAVIPDDSDKEGDTADDINEDDARPVRRRRRRAPEAIEAPAPVDDDEDDLTEEEEPARPVRRRRPRRYVHPAERRRRAIEDGHSKATAPKPSDDEAPATKTTRAKLFGSVNPATVSEPWKLERWEDHRKPDTSASLKKRSSTNEKGGLVGQEALYLMLSQGQDCRFGGLYGDPARNAGLLTLALIVADRKKCGVKYHDGIFGSFRPGGLDDIDANNASFSIARVIGLMARSVHDWTSRILANLILDTALCRMGTKVHDLAMDITRSPELSREWLINFRRGLVDMGHPMVSGEYADPYEVRRRLRKIKNANGQSLDVLSNVKLKGNGALNIREYVDLVGAVLGIDIAHLHKLPEKTALQVAKKALVERPAKHARKRDLRENAAYITAVKKNEEKGFRAARTPEEHAQNVAALRHHRTDAIRRSGFVLEDQPITPKQAHEITDAIKGHKYDPSKESFAAIMSLTRDMLGSNDNKYDNIYEIHEDIIRSDKHWTNGEMALLKALLARHIESLSRSNLKKKVSGSSRSIDFTGFYERNWSDPKAMDTPWPGEVLAKQFDRVVRDMSVTSHDDVIEQDKEAADYKFSKGREQEQETQEFKGGTPNFLTPEDIKVTRHSSLAASPGLRYASCRSREEFVQKYGAVSRKGTDAFKEASLLFDPVYTFVHCNRRQHISVTTAETVGRFDKDLEDIKTHTLDSVLRGKIYMAPTFIRSYGYGEAQGEIDRFPCPTSSFLKAAENEDGSVTVESVAGNHFFENRFFAAAALLLAFMQNSRHLSFDRSLKMLHTIDKLEATREDDGKTARPFSSRYLEIQSGVNHNDANRFIQDAAAIGLIDRTGGKLQGTLLGPASTDEQLEARDACEQLAPGILGQEQATKQDFVESGQFLSTYMTFRTDGFIVDQGEEICFFSPDEIIKGFLNLEGMSDLDNPFMMVIESACRRLDASVDRTVVEDMSEDAKRKSNLFEIRMDYAFSKVEKAVTDQHGMKAADARISLYHLVASAAPSMLNGLTDVGVAFRNTSKLYKGEGSGIMRTYGYWANCLANSEMSERVPMSQISREFNKVIRFFHGRSGMPKEIEKRIDAFVNDTLAVEQAHRAWNARIADLTAAAREFRRSYRALVKAVSRGTEAPSRRRREFASSVRSGTSPGSSS